MTGWARSLSLYVAGAGFPNKRGPTRLFEIAMCRPGDRVELVPEPKNPADPNAVMIVSERGIQLGYVTAERAPYIRKLLSEGRDLKPIFQEAVEGGAFIRISLDDNLPDLPPARESTDPEPDFYPDDIYLDE